MSGGEEWAWSECSSLETGTERKSNTHCNRDVCMNVAIPGPNITGSMDGTSWAVMDEESKGTTSYEAGYTLYHDPAH